MDQSERLEAERDRGVAFCRDGPEAASMVLPLLEAALSRQPDDAIAWESKGEAPRTRPTRGGIRCLPGRPGQGPRPGDLARRGGRASPPAPGDTAMPSPTGGKPSPSIPGDRTTTPQLARPPRGSAIGQPSPVLPPGPPPRADSPST